MPRNPADGVWRGRITKYGGATSDDPDHPRRRVPPARADTPAGFCGLVRDSDILVDQMLAWDNQLFRRDLGPVPEAVRDTVRRALLEFLDLL